MTYLDFVQAGINDKWSKTVTIEDMLAIKLNDCETLNLSNCVFEKIKKLIQARKYWIKFDKNIFKFFNLIKRVHYYWTKVNWSGMRLLKRIRSKLDKF